MLSILIPVYRWDVRHLVHELTAQAKQLGLEFELLVYDDCSGQQFFINEKIATEYNQIRYKKMPVNLGRSVLRNRLAGDARGTWLLFLDADAQVIHPDYLRKYWEHRHRAPVSCGGTAYATTPPRNPAHYLRWHYGRRREQRSAATRQAAPYRAFSTFNFLIRRDTFRSVRFDERLREYGHEDTIFGWELARRGIAIHHLNNPLRHEGLDAATVFLAKTERSISNLFALSRYYPTFDTRLLRAYRLHPFIVKRVAMMEPLLRRQLLSKRPSLRVFDLWKLAVAARAAPAEG